LNTAIYATYIGVFRDIQTLGSTKHLFIYYLSWIRYWDSAKEIPNGNHRCTEQWRN